MHGVGEGGVTDLEINSLTDEQLAQRLDIAQTTFLLAQTPEQRARLMQLTQKIVAEQERRAAQ